VSDGPRGSRFAAHCRGLNRWAPVARSCASAFCRRGVGRLGNKLTRRQRARCSRQRRAYRHFTAASATSIGAAAAAGGPEFCELGAANFAKPVVEVAGNPPARAAIPHGFHGYSPAFPGYTGPEKVQPRPAADPTLAPRHQPTLALPPVFTGVEPVEVASGGGGNRTR
jgi:hypothetical protein